jgi:hypothetical protein
MGRMGLMDVKWNGEMKAIWEHMVPPIAAEFWGGNGREKISNYLWPTEFQCSPRSLFSDIGLCVWRVDEAIRPK